MASYQYVFHMDGVSKTYPGGKKCFENIRLNFLPGVKIGVVGVNGSGKSTLLRIMAGIDKDFQGEAWAAKGVRVGYLPQEPELDPSLDVRGNVMLGVAAKQAKLDRYNELAMNYSDDTAEEMARLQDEIDAQGLWDLDSKVDVAMEALRCPPDNADVTTLSGGEKRRVALCRLLLDEPDLLLLDEPTTGLDPQARHVVWERLYQLKHRGVTLVLTTHYMDEAEQLCDRLVVMDHGRIVAEGSPRELIQRYSTREVLELRFPPGADVQVPQGIGERHEVLADRVLVYAHDGEAALADVHARGLTPDSSLVRRSSLEDVFLHLTGRTLVD